MASTGDHASQRNEHSGETRKKHGSWGMCLTPGKSVRILFGGDSTISSTVDVPTVNSRTPMTIGLQNVDRVDRDVSNLVMVCTPCWLEGGASKLPSIDGIALPL